MQYKQIAPSAHLSPYIHTFWELKGEKTDQYPERIFPDGCAGIVINLGASCLTDNGTTSMEFGKTYVVGAMTSFKDSFIDENTHLFGVCLKPGTFPDFYQYAPQYELLDQTIQLERSRAFDLNRCMDDRLRYVNDFFIRRLQVTNGLIKPVIDAIHQHQGRANIHEVARKHFITVRQLERKFKQQVGLSPKEYSRIIRFQSALSKIKSAGDSSLQDIAFDCGYYDHSHLTNDVKRISGLTPSQL
ncbi:AraC family transcriptional regulator [Nostoc ellipsosporum NOK]|nr:AraC family transcriptional regulator [Nostoc ellipsosporum NOK]